jgi:hypothetical protein
MGWRNGTGAIRPFAIPLLGVLTACVFGSLYWLFGIGETPFQGALTFAVLYGSVVAIIFGIFGIVWFALRLISITRQYVARPRVRVP